MSDFDAAAICICGHPCYEHHSVRWFLPTDRMEITYCEHTLLKPKQLCECTQFRKRQAEPPKNSA